MTTTIAKSSWGWLSPQMLSSLQRRLEPFSTEKLVEMVGAWTSGSMTDRSTTWTSQAACKGVPSETFFGPDDISANTRNVYFEQVYQRYCAGCPVKLECITSCMLAEEAHDQATEKERALSMTASAIRQRRHRGPADVEIRDRLPRDGMFGVGPTDRKVARKLIKVQGEAA